MFLSSRNPSPSVFPRTPLALSNYGTAIQENFSNFVCKILICNSGKLLRFCWQNFDLQFRKIYHYLPETDFPILISGLEVLEQHSKIISKTIRMSADAWSIIATNQMINYPTRISLQKFHQKRNVLFEFRGFLCEHFSTPAL